MNEANLSTTRTIHLAFMGSIVVYGVVLNVVLPNMFASGRGIELDPGTLQLLGKVLPVVYVGSLVFFTRFLKYRNLGSPTGTSMATRYQASHVAHLGFIESGAIYGLVLTFVGAPASWFYIAAGTALVLMLLAFPTESRYQDFAERVTGRAY